VAENKFLNDELARQKDTIKELETRLYEQQQMAKTLKRMLVSANERAAAAQAGGGGGVQQL
jgi:hypothetical protein